MGRKAGGRQGFEYRARVVKSSFDWGNIKQLEQPFEDLVIYETHVRGYTRISPLESAHREHLPV